MVGLLLTWWHTAALIDISGRATHLGAGGEVDYFSNSCHCIPQDRSGHLGIEELMVLAKRIDPDATPWKIQV